MPCCMVSEVLDKPNGVHPSNVHIVTVPTPEETYNAMAPDLRRKVDENRRARLALEEGMKQQQNAQLTQNLISRSGQTRQSSDHAIATLSCGKCTADLRVLGDASCSVIKTLNHFWPTDVTMST
ncbi:hypothetical protein B0F90DRAFT_1371371 [Multifurca ochricompacta]|uniref:Uncharacterized protein n=1 Tax=Multifurca ochricompacta TaxID=376703 RepID=A0AAD4M6I1_9AGAM|nr:hypothetical protein B0F90DRAFT_1371371 [Multifurca ochricompacta]